MWHRHNDIMEIIKVEVRLEVATKQAAERQAKNQGYASLAAMLKVVATQAARAETELRVSMPPTTQLELPVHPQHRGLPIPDKVVSRSQYIDPGYVYTNDPEAYGFYLQQGIFSLRP